MGAESQEQSARESSSEQAQAKTERERWERRRLITHLGKVFSRTYEIDVLPSGQEGMWACSLDPKVAPEVEKYIVGKRDSLDDLSPEAFVPKQILYDEKGAQEMEMDEVITILRHEAGHVKYTDFRLIIEGQKQAKDEGYLPTSFWLAWEGIEDPRVNQFEGEESPTVDRQIRTNMAKELQKRLKEAPLSEKPLILQFAYNSYHHWLYGEPIPELKGTRVAELYEQAKPLLDQYFEEGDLEKRKALQDQIWDIAKELEKKEIEQEEKRQMAQQKSQQAGEGRPGGEPSPTQPGQTGEGATPLTQEKEKPGKGKKDEQKSFLERLRESILGPEEEQIEKATKEEKEADPELKPPERFDLSKLSSEELREIEEAIKKLTPEQRAKLAKKARETIDEAQKEALEDKLNKMLKLRKNKQTGEYEAVPRTTSKERLEKAKQDFKEAVEEVEAKEKAEQERQEREQRLQEQLIRKLEEERRKKLEMEKAGFEENEEEKFNLYQELENAMYSHVRNFQRAMERVVPRKKEVTYEGGYFSGPRLDRRQLVRRAPVGDERFHKRPKEKPTGEPRLFIGLLVDDSGSMEGKKMEEARKTMIFFAKACREMRLPFMMAAFGDHTTMIKNFRQDFDNPAEKVKPRLIDSTDASGGYTDMHSGLKLTIEAMNDQRRRLRDSHGLIFVISDGAANAGLIGNALKEFVEENRGRLAFKALGLSGNEMEKAMVQGALNHYFGEVNCAYPETFEDLPDEAFRILRANLTRFKRFLR